jgi:hypothetical protein
MRQLPHFEKKMGYAVFCPMGQIAFDEMADLMSRAVLLCRQQKIGKLLIDSTKLSGFRLPEISERYNLAERLASDSASLVKIAHVAGREWVRSGRFAVQVARNRGLDTANFHTEPAALKWLLKPAG